MLTEVQIDGLTDDINMNWDLPYIGEAREAVLIRFLVKKVDFFLERNLPPEIYKYVADAADGTSATLFQNEPPLLLILFSSPAIRFGSLAKISSLF